VARHLSSTETLPVDGWLERWRAARRRPAPLALLWLDGALAGLYFALSAREFEQEDAAGAWLYLVIAVGWSALLLWEWRRRRAARHATARGDRETTDRPR
jgi:hypothetical protein